MSKRTRPGGRARIADVTGVAGAWSGPARDQTGSALVLVTISLAVLLGFAALVIDAALLYVTRVKLQNAADAAALAGASQLPVDREEAERLASDYISKNGSGADNALIQFAPGNDQIDVRIDRSVDLSLAGVLGFANTSVSAGAAARPEPLGAYWGAVPFGVVEQDFEFGQEYVLKLGAGVEPGPHRGNFGALALGGTGASNYRRNIELGYQGWLRVGDTLETEPGNMAGHTVHGIESRLGVHGRTSSCTYLDYEPYCPRLLVVPIIDSLDGSGRVSVKILGFAVFFLEDMYESPPGQAYVTGRFLVRHLSGEGGGIKDYGALTAKLVEN